jgi:hypothetical protein
MKNLSFCIGLPRSGSTLLMNLLQQNPSTYTTGTCPLPYLFDGVKIQTGSISEFIAMPQNTLTDCYKGFLRQGTDGWFSALTDKPNVISKSRVWDTYLNDLFSIYEDPKFIVCLRDLRDIIISFEKLMQKHTRITIGSKEHPFHLEPMSKRIELYCTDIGGNMGRPLHYLPHVHEWMQRRPNNFFVFRWEDFCRDPNGSIKSFYRWMGRDPFPHDLDNIPQSDYYEHDTVYRALVDHKTRSKFEPAGPTWPGYMTPDQSETVIHNCKWFYETFYPEVLRG